MTTREYPRWLHHPSGKSVIAPNAAYEASLGEGWYDTPADFPSHDAVGPGDAKPVDAFEFQQAQGRTKGKPGPKPKVKE